MKADWRYVLISVAYWWRCVDVCCGHFLEFGEEEPARLRRLPANLSSAVKDIAESLPTSAFAIVAGNSTYIPSEDFYEILCLLHEHNIQVININLSTQASKDMYHSYLMDTMDIAVSHTSFIICEPLECENILKELTSKNIIQRTLLYMFYWHYGPVSNTFVSSMAEAMRVAIITNPRPNVFRIYYNQAVSDKRQHLALVNWWSGRLFVAPVLPEPKKVYHDFNGRLFKVPVIHAPPWHFVHYNNDSTVNVTGGRDDKLLALLARKLNFKYEYFDPPERSQGSGISANGTFKGILGLIWKRHTDFFLGDVSMTWERLQGVEFSFLTLADSGAFLTHAPSKLSETLALIRPFQWDVWPLVLATMAAAGPALWVVIAAPYFWRGRRRRIRRKLRELFGQCCWYTTTLFLRQSSVKEPSRKHKARLVAVLVSLGATYVIGDMYSANLTSLLAKPAKEPAIGTIQALEEAMRYKGYELVVERHSSSLAILQNGTGVYGRLAKLMARQKVQRVRSVERGVRMVLKKRTVAILGGRETLYFDTERFGANNFHLSEKLYTRYSAIALQTGCPYIENFNNVVIRLFEAGILSKMTTDEYQKLGDRRTEPVAEGDRDGDDEATASSQQVESTRSLEPVSLRMLRGAFCLLGIGYLLAAIVFSCEIEAKRRQEALITKRAELKTLRILTLPVKPPYYSRIKSECQRYARAIRFTITRFLDSILF